jgi:hypothetical protein
MSLTLAQLDAARNDWADAPFVSDLITAARLQVALDELPLPEGWEPRFGLTGGTPYATAFSRKSGDEVIKTAPTMLESVLALGDALRSRT